MALLRVGEKMWGYAVPENIKSRFGWLIVVSCKWFLLIRYDWKINALISGGDEKSVSDNGKFSTGELLGNIQEFCQSHWIGVMPSQWDILNALPNVPWPLFCPPCRTWITSEVLFEPSVAHCWPFFGLVIYPTCSLLKPSFIILLWQCRPATHQALCVMHFEVRFNLLFPITLCE